MRWIGCLGLAALWALCSQAGAISDAAVSVWPEGLSEEMNALVAFRATFESAEGADVRLDMAAWYSYRITLNGRFVAFGPARGPKGLFRPDSWKLPVKSGRNDLQVEVAGYNCRNFYLMRQPPFFKASVSAGERVLAVSGKDFSAYRLPRVQKVPRYSYQRTFCEAYEVPGREAGPLKLAAAPEPKLIPRVAPPPAFEFKAALAPVALSRLEEDSTLRPCPGRALTLPGNSPHFDGFPLDELAINTTFLAQRLVYRETREPTSAERTAKAFALKDGAAVRFDVGLNDTGFPGTTVTVKKPGRLVFFFDETLVNGQISVSERKNFSSTNLLLWDFTEPGVYEVDAFEPYTMRWLEVCVLSGEMSITPARFRSYKNPTARAATFRASDPALEKIFEAAKETLMQNAVDVFTDCPSRERAGWNCDAFFTGPAATLLTGSTDLERVFEETQALAPAFEDIPDGMFPMCYPSDHKPDDYIPNWAMWFVLESEEYLARSGDRATIDALRARFEKLVDFLWTFRNADGLLEKLPSWVFVEWSKANDYVQDVNYPSNMTWSQMLDAMSRLYGRTDLAEEAARVRAKIREQSWNGAFFRDHAVRGSDGRLVVQEKDITESCQYYAFFSGVATPETHPQLWRELIEAFGPARDEKKTHPEVSRSAPFIGNYLRLKILERARRGDLVLKDCKGYFEKMADLTGTLWEYDDTSASCCHGFASYAAVLLARSVLGVERIDLPAKKLVLARDVRAELDWVEGSFPVGADCIRVRREGKAYQTKVPEGWTVEYEGGARHEASPRFRVATTNRLAYLNRGQVHRGGGRDTRPDNALETFLWCWGHGVAPEADARTTKDGVVIALHDATLERVGRGISAELAKTPVKELEWAEIRDVDVGSYLSPEFAATRIATLDAVCAAMAHRPERLLFVDEKGATPRQIADIARRHGVERQVIYTSPRFELMADWQKEVPGGLGMVWLGTWAKTNSPAAVAKADAFLEESLRRMAASNWVGISQVQFHVRTDFAQDDPFCPSTAAMKRGIELLHSKGITVQALSWTEGKNPELYRRLWELGFDNLCTDDPLVLFDFLRGIVLPLTR